MARRGVQQAAPSTARADRPGRPGGRLHKPHQRGRLSWMSGQVADAHMNRNATRTVAHDGPRRAAVVAVTNGRLDGSTERSTEPSALARSNAHAEGSPKSLARGSGSCVSWMADPGVLTAGDENGCWSRSLVSRCAQSCHEPNGLLSWWATTNRWSVRQNGRG